MYEFLVYEHMSKTATVRNKTTNWNKLGDEDEEQKETELKN